MEKSGNAGDRSTVPRPATAAPLSRHQQRRHNKADGRPRPKSSSGWTQNLAPDESNSVLWWVLGAVIMLLIAVLLTSDVLFIRQHGGDDDDGGDGKATKPTQPLHTPPPRTFAEKTADAAGREAQTGSSRNGGSSQPSCYTLEEYSVKFVMAVQKRQQQQTPQHFYRCGTRLTDMNTEVNKSVVDLCAAVAGPTSFPTLRVYLAGAFEEKAHLRQKHNIAAQRILLERLNDDYCDCLDGTDELQTTACSMSGAVTPLSHNRWKQYLTSNAQVRLYEEEEAPSKQRTERLLRRLGGPVLPFRCRNDPDVWLAPSRVGDGVVDCCDGSDEEPQHQEQGNEVLQRWSSRVTAMARYLGGASGPMSRLYPASNRSRNVAGMLLDNGLTALMSCRRVKAERMRDAYALHELVKLGHAVYKERKASGWEKYGKGLVERQERLEALLQSTEEKFKEVREGIKQRMDAVKAPNPFVAGIPKEELDEAEELFQQIRRLQIELRHVYMTLGFRWLGDDYEFYPLADAHYDVPMDRVVSTAQSSAESVQQRSEGYRYNDSYVLKAPPVHVDNVSYHIMSLFPYVHLIGVQNLTEWQATVFLRRSGELAANETFNASGSKDINRGPPIIFGHWHPDITETSVDGFASLDPSGGAVLLRRLLVADPAPVLGGVLQVLPHERLTHTGRLRRVLHIAKTESSQEKLKKVSSGANDDDDDDAVPMPLRYNAPDLPATQIFAGGLSCGLEAVREPEVADSKSSSGAGGGDGTVEPQFTQGRLVYACAERDGVLEWHRNGKCEHEVLLGTPSACPRWTLEVAAARLRSAEEALRQEEAEAESIGRKKGV